MKRCLRILAFGVFAFLVLTGCLGTLEKRAERAERGLSEAKFETYSKAAAVGVTIEINNTLAIPVKIKLTIPEEKDAWKSFEVPAKGTLHIEVGIREYLLEALTTNESSSMLYTPSDNEIIRITNNWFAD